MNLVVWTIGVYLAVVVIVILWNPALSKALDSVVRLVTRGLGEANTQTLDVLSRWTLPAGLVAAFYTVCIVIYYGNVDARALLAAALFLAAHAVGRRCVLELRAR